MACPNAPRVTRQTIACPIISVPKELSGLSLPTYEDILLCCLDEKFGVSDRATAAVATSVLHDLGIICDENMAKVIDKNKIRREKEKIRKVITEEDNQMKEVNGTAEEKTKL
ncbi:hypothetical protein J6590_069871 [Homalodisca vitripennis]|nr:hypothetical protein J6590_069871 [Homalodisca vitripennis]